MRLASQRFLPNSNVFRAARQNRSIDRVDCSRLDSLPSASDATALGRGSASPRCTNNLMIKKKLSKAGIHVTDDDGVGEQDLRQMRRHVYAGHALRGNAESTLDAVHRLGHVQYDALEHVHRARHTHATYERHYKRVVPVRVTTAARQHPQHGELTADEVLFLWGLTAYPPRSHHGGLQSRPIYFLLGRLPLPPISHPSGG